MTEETSKSTNQAKINRRQIILIFVLAVAIVIGGYWYVSAQTVYIDLSQIEAPIINLSPKNSGTLQAVFVKVGDVVAANQPIARVGSEIVESKTSGEIISVNENIGEYENAVAGRAVVATMIDPNQLRVVGRLDEDKGLAAIRVGDLAKFTVDAFGSKVYYGVVDEIGQTSVESITSNVFNQRPTNRFNIYVRFDPTKYPELKNGMSARIWVYKS